MRLRDGRWVPNYPSRPYRRGRDCGWIREALEGSIYLLISGLYTEDTRAAGWILDGWGVRGLATYHGSIDVTYTPDPANGTITLEEQRRNMKGEHRTLTRFRHAEKERLEHVRVNGGRWDRFDAETNDVDIAGLDGSVTIIATFA